ncbi:MAG: hypothetical protein ACJAZT_000489 [Gammaproteobacteria bacterium]|jgi:hypothetical protein
MMEITIYSGLFLTQPLYVVAECLIFQSTSYSKLNYFKSEVDVLLEDKVISGNKNTFK